MRSGFSIIFVATVVFAGGFFYNLAQAVCPTPLSYRVGELNEQFELSLDEAKVAISEAAELWEEMTGQNLFSYDEEATFTINFVFDERQEFADAETSFKDKLEAAESVNSSVGETHTTLLEEYQDLQQIYTNQVKDFEDRLLAYNQEVEEYNKQGGAPVEAFEALEQEKVDLDIERQTLDQLANQLNEMADEINRLGEKGNALIENYNEKVGVFNEQFGESREFTQGDYQGDKINIYTYKDKLELRTVLAHELGHSLSLDHVEGEESVMHYLIGGQPPDLSLSLTDVAEFNRVCGDMSIWDKIMYRLSNN